MIRTPGSIRRTADAQMEHMSIATTRTASRQAGVTCARHQTA